MQDHSFEATDNFQPESVISDRFRLVRRLGRGGDGIAFLAVDQKTGGEVTLKAYPLRGNWAGARAWEREARALGNLDHPAIPKYVSHQQLASGQLIVAWEHVTGESLDQRLRRGQRLADDEVLVLTQQALDVLVYLQGLNPPVIHGDIKPSNLILDQTGRLYLIDFAGVRETLRPRDLSGLGGGTPGYAAPEQVSGRPGVNSDLYALGVTIVQLLSHVHPCDLPSRGLALDFAGHVSAEPWFIAWLERMTAPEPQVRFRDAREALLAFRARGLPAVTAGIEALPAGGSAGPVSLVPPSGSRMQLLTSADILALTIGGVGFLGKGVRSEAVFWVFWTAFIGFFTFGVMMRGTNQPSLMLVFLIPFWLVSVYVACRLCFAMFGTTAITVSPREVRVTSKLGAWSRRVEAPTSSWGGARLEEVRTRHGRRQFCALSVGARDVEFGHQLSHPERVWAVTLLNEQVARRRG
jgi:hypothetical protein